MGAVRRSRGQAQPWERAAFFDDDDFADIGEAELRNSRTVVEGALRPRPPHVDSALAAALSRPSRQPPSIRVGPTAPTVRDAAKVGVIALGGLATVVLVSVLLGLLFSLLE